MKDPVSILVVDDEAESLNAAAECLKKAGFVVATAADGFKALAACKVRTPQMILLDLQMPLMSGAEVYSRLRADEKSKHIPIVFWIKKDELVKLPKDLAADDCDVLTKPINDADLVSKIRGVLKMHLLQEELRKKDSQIKDLALSDPITSLRSARYLLEFLKAEITRCKRYKVPMTMVVLEIDHNKEFLRQHGQKSADSLVTQLTAIISRYTRESDVVAHTGTCELVFVLTHTAQEGAIEVAERLRTTIAESTFTVNDKTLSITATLGICQLTENVDAEGKMILAHTRTAVAQGHESGGNISMLVK